MAALELLAQVGDETPEGVEDELCCLDIFELKACVIGLAGSLDREVVEARGAHC